MHAMPRRTFRTTATAMLAVPSMSSAAAGARTPRSTSPFPVSVSMMLPETPHTMPPSSCRSSPGNSNDDAYRSIVDFQSLQSTSPDLRPKHWPCPPPIAPGRENWKRLVKSKQHYALLHKAIAFLHDNRAHSSKYPDTARRLRQINAELRADKSHRVLKFVLNAVFLAFGFLLLLSVLAAIAYTSTGQCHCLAKIK